MNPLSHIAQRHDAIDQRLTEWAKWVRVHHKMLGPNPMWKNYKTPRQWDVDPHIPLAINTLDALEVERAVSKLPKIEKTLLRWFYVWPGLHINAVVRETGVSASGLQPRLELARNILMGVLENAPD